METITVWYDHSAQSRKWVVEDTFGDAIGYHEKKVQAVKSARQFAKDRARASGAEVVLVVEKTSGAVSNTYDYGG